MREKICHIIGAAEIEALAVDRHMADLVIAADGGYAHLKRFGIACDVAVGDFDSLGFTPSDCETLSFPPEKDDTDLILAAKCGLCRGYTRFALYGCLGGALSHTLANLQTLAYLNKNGAIGALIGNNVFALIVTGALSMSLPLDMKVSVFAFGGTASGVTLTGFKYPLTQAMLTVDHPIGVSNEPAEKEARIFVNEGSLVVVLEGVMRDPLDSLLSTC